MFPKTSSVVPIFEIFCLIFLIQCKNEAPVAPKMARKIQSVQTIQEKISEEPKIQTISNSSKKYIYLTFDDGPNKGTSNVIKSLQKENVPATLFLVGSHIKGSRAQQQDFERISQDTLFQIANHSYSHANNKFSDFYKDSIRVLEDFVRMNDSLNRKLMIARTPGRNIWRLDSIKETDLKSSKKSADYLAKNNFVLVGWDLEWKSDSTHSIKESGEEILQQIDEAFEKKRMQTENHLVILTHDQYFRDEDSVKELDFLLEKLNKREDFVFRKIKDYPGITTEVY